MKLTLYKYIINEIWPMFLASLFVSVFIIVATRMLSIMELIVNRGVNAGHVGRMLLYLIPDIVMFALPAVSLMAVVVAFLRLSADSEIISLKSSGISLYQMLPPVLILSFIALVISLSVGIIAVPWGNRSFKDVIFQIAESKADLGIKERIFCEPFNDVVFYVNSYSTRDRDMKDVFVVDRRDAKITNTIIAKEGRILSYPQQRIITLHFLKGTISTVEKNLDSARSIKFDVYDMNIGLKDIMSALASRKKAPKELSVKELMEQINISPKGELKYNEMMIELLEKFSIPMAVFLMGIIGVPLGVQIRSRGRSAGIGISLVVFLVYYMCLAGMRSICETGNLSPKLGVWIPSIFLFISCIYLLKRVANERSINFLSVLFSKVRRKQFD
jgi:lipopolysaccharide export system permease protein